MRLAVATGAMASADGGKSAARVGLAVSAAKHRRRNQLAGYAHGSADAAPGVVICVSDAGTIGAADLHEVQHILVIERRRQCAACMQVVQVCTTLAGGEH